MQVRCSINDLVIRTQAEREFQRKYAGHVHSQVRAKERNLATASLLRDNRIYVTCQIPMIFPTYSRAPVRTISWWYRLWPCRLLQRHRSHSNPCPRRKISPSLAQKILGDNPKRLYGL